MADKITDEQLVEELERFGEKVKLPIKRDKRALLIKKLNHLRSKQRGNDRSSKRLSGRKTLDVFSSDDSETECAGQAEGRKKTKTARAVDMVTRSLRQRTAAASTPVASPHFDHDTSSSVLRRPLRSRMSENSRSPTSSSPRKGTHLNQSIGSKSNKLYPDLDALNESANRSTEILRDETFESSDDEYLIEQDADDSSYEVQNKSVNTTFTIESNNSRYDTNTSPYRSNLSFTNHIHEDRKNTPKRKSVSNHVSPRNQNEKRYQYKKRYPEHVHVSRGIVMFVAIFFVIVATGYIFLRKENILSWISFGTSTKLGPRDKFLLCTEKSAQDCYDQQDVTKAMVVITDLFDLLSTKKGKVNCGTAPASEKNMSRDEFQVYLRKMGHTGNLEHLMNACLDHIIENPHWKISALDKDGEPANKRHQVEFLEATVAAMSLFCRIQRSFSRVMFAVFVLFLISVTLFLLLKFIRWRIAVNEKERHEVYSMVENIIDILKKHYDLTQQEEGKNLQPYLALQHVRDQLLPPATRKELLPIWNKAVKFIEANESRIRLEEQTIQGEEFAVWRWIHTSPNGNKVWQGQAFGEHNESGNNPVLFSPTPCLKIRNMFDADVENDTDWHLSVQDAILEKCRDVNSILHTYVDKDSKEGCVYLKCSSCQAAGNARQALHGWWFDRRLVTARYLKLDYYHNRFPDSVNAVKALLPSTDQMSSLSQPYYRSSLEMT
ncbi:inner nuclear membrane protein Man1-like isoform X2 [Gigantopelta aegis]|uniref:inner nuclear membrane protein Man1-like isoform X2 n=1 Tax=Gigantopelta aegis TaxID=1735272 RepID=UPI001B88E449|nr:inner nuclear membrane protein Man1-like isoform X2 [Gigantopelta aegis]